jgi:DNA-binding response OmpR family regulator
LPHKELTFKRNTPRILIVDDDADLLDITQAFLESRGYDVGRAQSGDEAMKLIESSRPNLILLDVMMPKMDGFRLCRVVKSDARFRHIPVIFLTAKDDAQSRMEGQKCGGDDYLTKPFDLDALEVRVKAQLKKMSKLELSEKIENLLGITESGGFLVKLDLDELSILLSHIQERLKK